MWPFMASLEHDRSSLASRNYTNWQARLALIDRSIDWRAFDKYLRWIKPEATSSDTYPPLALFKAMLLQHWHGLIAADFDYLVNDSISFRTFIGIGLTDPAPDHLAVSTFRRLLVERDVATDIFSELRRQFESAALLAAAGEADTDGTAAQAGGCSSPYALASDVTLFEPPAWVALENAFLRFWSGHGTFLGNRGFRVADLDAIPEAVKSHFVVLRAMNVQDSAATDVADDNAGDDAARRSGERADDYVIEWVGDSIADGAQVAPVKATLRERADANLETYGHAGIHSNLINACQMAFGERRAIRTSGYILNDSGQACQFWSLFVPATAEDAAVPLLAGIMFFTPTPEPILAGARTPYTLQNFQHGRQDFLNADVGSRALGPLEWVKIEQGLLDFWNRIRDGRNAPQMADIKLSDLVGLGPNLTLTRVLPDNEFRYEFIGQHIKMANEGDATGTVISAKADFNTAEYGHPGLQRDLLAVFNRTAERLRPAGTSTYYVNSGGRRCQMWTLHAPIADGGGRVAMLLGVTLIRPLAVN